ncbi:MAG TPA: AAA family ATPase [Vicinamibacterales bacterium]|nr:AAA family ATPase [Vicinamibacterales bacterium]
MSLQDRLAVSSEVSAEQAFAAIAGLEGEVGKVIVGQHVLIRRLLTGLLAAIPFATARAQVRAGCGHVLLEGVPGVAKTLIATTLAQAIAARFQRIQLTPDLLPADILGTRIYDAKAATFRIEHGPVFTNILLADEINRATPKTQSALLEAMQERQVTLADTTFALEDPFWVLATQNPVEQEGVYSLPEAQLDRFSMMLRVGYPDHGEEVRMLHARLADQTIERRASPSDVTFLRGFVRDTVFVDDKILEYIVGLGRATRAPAEVGRAGLSELLILGMSPRSYQHVLALARVTAFLHGRTYVLPADVKEIYCDAARHRIARSVRAQAENIAADQILEELLQAVPIP